MRRRLAVFAAAVAFGGGLAAVPTAPFGAPVAVAKSCMRGQVHAVAPDGSNVCLRAGQFCRHSHRWQRFYQRYGFRCNAYDSYSKRWRLTRG